MKLPTDPCALLTADEVKTVLPEIDRARAIAAEAADPTRSVGCDWEAGTAAAGLTVKVGDASPYPAIARNNEIELRDFRGQKISGLGDWAGAWAVSGVGADAAVYGSGRVLRVEYIGLGAREKVDALAKLAAAAYGRLP